MCERTSEEGLKNPVSHNPGSDITNKTGTKFIPKIAIDYWPKLNESNEFKLVFQFYFQSEQSNGVGIS